MMRFREACLVCVYCLAWFSAVWSMARPAEGADPPPGVADWSDWEKYRAGVVHPATLIKPEDLARARENVRRYAWARDYVERVGSSAAGILKRLSGGYVDTMIEPTTPGCVGPCPACRAKGLPWHPNGQWSWSSSRPEQITCSVCKTRFPNEVFPEYLVRAGYGYGEYAGMDPHVALLKETVPAEPSGRAVREAIFLRQPGLEERQVPPLSLPDVVFPFLAQGYLRSGPNGREGLAMLNASDSGGHHHLDSLNLYYCGFSIGQLDERKVRFGRHQPVG